MTSSAFQEFFLHIYLQLKACIDICASIIINKNSSSWWLIGQRTGLPYGTWWNKYNFFNWTSKSKQSSWITSYFFKKSQRLTIVSLPGIGITWKNNLIRKLGRVQIQESWNNLTVILILNDMKNTTYIFHQCIQRNEVLSKC